VRERERELSSNGQTNYLRYGRSDRERERERERERAMS